MADRRRARPLVLRALACAVAGLLLASCSGDDGSSQPGSTSAGSTPSGSATASPTPGPSESARLYTQSRPSSGVEGDAEGANAAVRAFARAISSGDRGAIDEVIHAPTPEDPTVIDQTVRAFAGVEWDDDSLRWTHSGFLGPCYLLAGEGDEGPVHLTGTAAWNAAEGEWEFTTTGFPGGADYPELPTC